MDARVWLQAVMTQALDRDDMVLDLTEDKPRTWHIWGAAQDHKRCFAQGCAVLVAKEVTKYGVQWLVQPTGPSRISRRFNTLGAQKYLRTLRKDGKVLTATPAQTAAAEETAEYVTFQQSR